MLVDEAFMQSVNLAKFVDTGIGIWVWVGLGWAIRFGSGVAVKPIRIILGVAVTSMVGTDILGPILWGILSWFVYVRESRKTRRERRTGEGSDSSDDGSSSGSSDDESSSDEESDSSDDEEEEGEGEGEGEGGQGGFYGGEEGQWDNNNTAGGGGEGEHDEGYYDENGNYVHYDHTETGNYYSAAATYREQAEERGEAATYAAGGFQLDRAVACTPGEFSLEWDRLEESGGEKREEKRRASSRLSTHFHFTSLELWFT